MFGLKQRQLEKIATKTAIWIGLSISFFGILLIIDNVLDIDFFPESLERAGIIILGIASIILAVCVFISVMLNISRMANSIEAISDRAVK